MTNEHMEEMEREKLGPVLPPVIRGACSATIYSRGAFLRTSAFLRTAGECVRGASRSSAEPPSSPAKEPPMLLNSLMDFNRSDYVKQLINNRTGAGCVREARGDNGALNGTVSTEPGAAIIRVGGRFSGVKKSPDGVFLCLGVCICVNGTRFRRSVPLLSAAMCRLLLSFPASVTTSGQQQQRASRSPPPPPPPPSPPPSSSSSFPPASSSLLLLCYFKRSGASWVLQCLSRACLVTYGGGSGPRKTTIPRVPRGPHQSIRLQHIRGDGVGGGGQGGGSAETNMVFK